MTKHRRAPPPPQPADWSQPLPRPLVIPKVMTLTTLADVRALLGHLPAETLDKTTWRHVFRCLDEAAHSVDIDKAVEVYALLQMVLMMEGVEYSNPKRPDAASRRHGRSMN